MIRFVLDFLTRPRCAIAAGLLLTITAQAQTTAAYYDHGSACNNPVGPEPHVSASLPVPGWDLTWQLTGQPGAWSYLLFDTQVDWSGVSLTPYGLTGCTLWLGGNPISVPVWLGYIGVGQHRMSLPGTIPPGTYLFAQSAMVAPGANPTGMVTSELGVARIGVEPPLSPSEILGYAPVVRIHPSEGYFPMDPSEFIRLSRFRHHRGWQADQGYNKRTLSWVTTNSTHPDYYDIPVSFIDTYGLNANGTNRRPRDSNSGSSWNVFLQPVGAPAGDRTPNGDVPAFYFYRRNGTVHEVQYWWFMGYNDAPATINHQGDWEHVTVHVERREIVGVHFASHNSGSYYPASQLRWYNHRPVVYMANGTHASYPAPGTWYFGIDRTADGGYQWDIRQNLLRLSLQPWKDYAGAWGEVGSTATTTGPLGPWHKRHEP